MCSVITHSFSNLSHIFILVALAFSPSHLLLCCRKATSYGDPQTTNRGFLSLASFSLLSSSSSSHIASSSTSAAVRWRPRISDPVVRSTGICSSWRKQCTRLRSHTVRSAPILNRRNCICCTRFPRAETMLAALQGCGYAYWGKSALIVFWLVEAVVEGRVSVPAPVLPFRDRFPDAGRARRYPENVLTRMWSAKTYFGARVRWVIPVSLSAIRRYRLEKAGFLHGLMQETPREISLAEALAPGSVVEEGSSSKHRRIGKHQQRICRVHKLGEGGPEGFCFRGITDLLGRF
ncbi:hypothetical protein C8F01DRAFT_718843 [Mycena amicta]|nr:hypothetical protein C8F01DRAFT_718843 [Mycena amicta]